MQFEVDSFQGHRPDASQLIKVQLTHTYYFSNATRSGTSYEKVGGQKIFASEKFLQLPTPMFQFAPHPSVAELGGTGP